MVRPRQRCREGLGKARGAAGVPRQREVGQGGGEGVKGKGSKRQEENAFLTFQNKALNAVANATPLFTQA